MWRVKERSNEKFRKNSKKAIEGISNQKFKRKAIKHVIFKQTNIRINR